MEKVILEVPLLKSLYVNRHLLGIDPSESWYWTQNFALFCRLNSIWSNKELWLLTESRTLLLRQFRSVGVVTLSVRHFKTRKICFWDTSSWKGRNEQVLQGLGTYLETSLLTAYPLVVHLQGILNVDRRGLSKQTAEADVIRETIIWRCSSVDLLNDKDLLYSIKWTIVPFRVSNNAPSRFNPLTPVSD